MQYISLNYKISETKDLKLSFENRGFLFGDGFFETIKVINNKNLTFNKESKENGEMYGSIKPKEIANLINDTFKTLSVCFAIEKSLKKNGFVNVKYVKV